MKPGHEWLHDCSLGQGKEEQSLQVAAPFLATQADIQQSGESVLWLRPQPSHPTCSTLTPLFFLNQDATLEASWGCSRAL